MRRKKTSCCVRPIGGVRAPAKPLKLALTTRPGVAESSLATAPFLVPPPVPSTGG